jgi:hypothetical protein
MAEQPLRRLLHELADDDVTLDGFRAAFSTWTAERTAFPTAVREAALGHAEGHAKSDSGQGNTKVARAYQRGDLFEKRAKLMEAWGTFVTTPIPTDKGNVAEIGRARARS